MTPKRTKWPSRKVVLVVVVLVALVLIGYVHHATGLWPWQGGVQVLLETLSS